MEAARARRAAGLESEAEAGEDVAEAMLAEAVEGEGGHGEGTWALVA